MDSILAVRVFFEGKTSAVEYFFVPLQLIFEQ